MIALALLLNPTTLTTRSPATTIIPNTTASTTTTALTSCDLAVSSIPPRAISTDKGYEGVTDEVAREIFELKL